MTSLMDRPGLRTPNAGMLYALIVLTVTTSSLLYETVSRGFLLPMDAAHKLQQSTISSNGDRCQEDELSLRSSNYCITVTMEYVFNHAICGLQSYRGWSGD